LDLAYKVLHLSGYYDGVNGVNVIKEGFNAAYYIIEKIKPENPIEIKESRGDKVKRICNRLLMSLTVLFMKNKY